MDPTVVGLIAFTCTFGGSLLGIWLRTALPGHHLESESKDTIKLGIGLIATMTALVPGSRCTISRIGDGCAVHRPNSGVAGSASLRLCAPQPIKPQTRLKQMITTFYHIRR